MELDHFEQRLSCKQSLRSNPANIKFPRERRWETSFAVVIYSRFESISRGWMDLCVIARHISSTKFTCSLLKFQSSSHGRTAGRTAKNQSKYSQRMKQIKIILKHRKLNAQQNPIQQQPTPSTPASSQVKSVSHFIQLEIFYQVCLNVDDDDYDGGRIGMDG